jgi:DNA-directed RNA polymerase subunit RPC12/RpoP
MWNAFPAAMSEFKYACPVCGQHMKCDSSQSGTVMECPTCFQKITAPQAPATDAPKFIITGTKVGERPIPTAPVDSGTATAPEKDFPVTTFVLVVLLCAVIGAAFLFRGKIFKTVPTKTIAVTNVSGTPPNPAPGGLTATVSVGNIALGRASFASSQQAEHPTQNGNDGNSTTRWCAENGSILQWWEVDLGAMAVITNTRVLWEQNSIYHYKIEVSPNNTNWTRTVNQTTNFTLAQVNSDNFSATGRYVRITLTGLQPGSWASFFEFQVFGSINNGGDGGSKTNGNSTNQR